MERGELLPDHSLTLGDRTLYYFKAERKEEVRQALGLPEVTDDNIRAVLSVADHPKAAGADPKEFFDNRFIKELEDSGFVKELYGQR